MENLIARTSLTSSLEAHMDRIVRVAAPLAVVLVVAACAAGSPSPSAVATPEAAPSATDSPVATEQAPSASAAPSPAGSPTAFTSNIYGYSLMVPAGWTTVAAMLEWDGKGMPSHDVAEADQFVSPGPASSWFLGATSSNDLAAEVKVGIAGIATDHGDTCPPVPASQDPIKIGAEPGVLLSYDCGILINTAITVHDGRKYVFGFRDPASPRCHRPKRSSDVPRSSRVCDVPGMNGGARHREAWRRRVATAEMVLCGVDRLG